MKAHIIDELEIKTCQISLIYMWQGEDVQSQCFNMDILRSIVIYTDLSL